MRWKKMNEPIGAMAAMCTVLYINNNENKQIGGTRQLKISNRKIKNKIARHFENMLIVIAKHIRRERKHQTSQTHTRAQQQSRSKMKLFISDVVATVFFLAECCDDARLFIELILLWKPTV